jgi:hypothetical protein
LLVANMRFRFYGRAAADFLRRPSAGTSHLPHLHKGHGLVHLPGKPAAVPKGALGHGF